MAKQNVRSMPVRSAIHFLESGSADHDGTGGSDHRIITGSQSLKALAAQALSTRGVDHVTDHVADQGRSAPVDQGNRCALDYPVCPHVDDIELAYWYGEHPEVTCAQCWLERHRELREGAPTSLNRPAGAAVNPEVRR